MTDSEKLIAEARSYFDLAERASSRKASAADRNWWIKRFRQDDRR